MPPPDPAHLGPLAALIGTWEGDSGVDVSFQNAPQRVVETHYRERTSFSPFGPVDNGQQCLYGLDYRMAAWRGDEVDPFHTEVGYWLWDGGSGEVLRSFMVPRGCTIIAGGVSTADAKAFTMRAEVGSTTYGILSNRYLDEVARTVSYTVTVTTGIDEWSYEETTVVDLAAHEADFSHTDRNVLRRVE
jgi:hypothetical protein